MSISGFKLPSEMAGAPIFSCVRPKSISPMEIGNGTLRKSAKKRQKAPCILLRRWMTRQILANAQESAVEKWERAFEPDIPNVGLESPTYSNGGAVALTTAR
jgi:hypothetical protein